MNLLEDWRLHMPKFWSEKTASAFLKDITQFPPDLNSRFYSTALNSEIVFQGDAIKDLLVVSLPNPEVSKAPALIVSNTCDIDLENQRRYPARLVYTPILNFSKYLNMLKVKNEYDPSHENAVRSQKVSSMFFLPKGSGIDYEAVVFFDRVCSCDNEFLDRSKLQELRLFSLSDKAFWLFIVKLSVHFTRVSETESRN